MEPSSSSARNCRSWRAGAAAASAAAAAAEAGVWSGRAGVPAGVVEARLRVDKRRGTVSDARTPARPPLRRGGEGFAPPVFLDTGTLAAACATGGFDGIKVGVAGGFVSWLLVDDVIEFELELLATTRGWEKANGSLAGSEVVGVEGMPLLLPSIGAGGPGLCSPPAARCTSIFMPPCCWREAAVAFGLAPWRAVSREREACAV